MNHVKPFVAFLKKQEQYHQNHSFQTEYLTILDKFEVAYDPKYLFEFYKKEAVIPSKQAAKTKSYRPNTYTKIFLHLVLVVKGREYGIPKNHKPNIHKCISLLLKKEGHDLLEIHCMPDHTHLLLVFKPAKNLVQLVDAIKEECAAYVRTKLGFALVWQDGFGVFSYSPSHIPSLRKYILNQEAHHQISSFREDYWSWVNESDENIKGDWLRFYDELD